MDSRADGKEVEGAKANRRIGVVFAKGSAGQNDSETLMKLRMIESRSCLFYRIESVSTRWENVPIGRQLISDCKHAWVVD